MLAAQLSQSSERCLDATPLGGLQVVSHTAVRDHDGRVEVYARAVGDGLHLRAQGYPGGAFLPSWIPLGVHVTSTPAAILDAHGRVVLFARASDGALWASRKIAPAGRAFTPWAPLSGWVDAPVAARDPQERITVCGVAADACVWAATEIEPGSGNFQPWVRVTDRVAGRPALISGPGGPLALFVRVADGGVRQHWLGPQGWSGATSLGGATEGNPAPVLDARGRVNLFARGANQGIWQAVELLPGVWSPWQQIGYQPHVGRDAHGNPMHAGDPLPFLDADGRLEVIVRAGPSKDLWHAVERVPGYGWGTWASLGVLSTQASPAVVTGSDGRIQLHHRDLSLTLSYTTQTVAGVW